MGKVIEISDDVVLVKFEDGSVRSYYKENFIHVPQINQKVQLNKEGFFVLVEEIDSGFNAILVIVFVILFILLIYYLVTGFVNSAVEVGNGLNSCITDCSNMG